MLTRYSYQAKVTKGTKLALLGMLALTSTSCKTSQPVMTKPIPQQPAVSTPVATLVVAQTPYQPLHTTSAEFKDLITIHDLILSEQIKAEANGQKLLVLEPEIHERTNALPVEAVTEFTFQEAGMASCIVELDQTTLATMNLDNNKIVNAASATMFNSRTMPVIADDLDFTQKVITALIVDSRDASTGYQTQNELMLGTFQVFDKTTMYPGDPLHNKRAEKVEDPAHSEDPKLFSKEVEDEMVKAVRAAMKHGDSYFICGIGHYQTIYNALKNDKDVRILSLFCGSPAKVFSPKTKVLRDRVKFARKKAIHTRLVDNEKFSLYPGVALLTALSAQNVWQFNKSAKGEKAIMRFNAHNDLLKWASNHRMAPVQPNNSINHILSPHF